MNQYMYKYNTNDAMDGFMVIMSVNHCDIPVRGSFASGNDLVDRKIENQILARAEYDIWAWASVGIQVRYYPEDGERVESETEYIGGCNYKNAEDFKENSGYYQSMVFRCIQNIFEKIK